MEVGREGAAGAGKTTFLSCTVVAGAQLVAVPPSPSPAVHLGGGGAVGVSSPLSCQQGCVPESCPCLQLPTCAPPCCPCHTAAGNSKSW